MRQAYSLTGVGRAVISLVTMAVNILTDRRSRPDGAAVELNGAIAARIAALRKRRRLSFDELAARSCVSKGMLVQIEQARANPSIATLCRLAAALRVSVADLVASDAGAGSAVRVAANAARILWTGPKGGSAALLVGSQGPDMLELWHWTLQPGERYESRPHSAGTRELVHVVAGTLAMEVDGTTHLIEAGTSACAATDRPHAYACNGRKRTRFTLVVSERAPE
jgi:transcriptional regulator with XRE-family HTH domain